jgi:hypothetical protein
MGVYYELFQEGSDVGYRVFADQVLLSEYRVDRDHAPDSFTIEREAEQAANSFEEGIADGSVSLPSE